MREVPGRWRSCARNWTAAGCVSANIETTNIFKCRWTIEWGLPGPMRPWNRFFGQRRRSTSSSMKQISRPERMNEKKQWWRTPGFDISGKETKIIRKSDEIKANWSLIGLNGKTYENSIGGNIEVPGWWRHYAKDWTPGVWVLASDCHDWVKILVLNVSLSLLGHVSQIQD